MAKGISEIVGEADSPDGSKVMVYRALRHLFCAACGGPIREGGLFTRCTLPGQGLRILPRCRGCEPFTPPGFAEVQSALIEALFTPPAGEAKPEAEGPARRDDLAEAVMKRLGPALNRARKGK